MQLSGIDQLMDFIMKCQNICALTGAGISTTCGIPDFRGPQGLYGRRDISADKIFDLETFQEDPSLFYNFIGELTEKIDTATPGKGHLFLKKLEQLGKLKTVVTQNVDALHTKAGNTQVIELHGNFETYGCTSCKAQVKRGEDQYQPIQKAVASKKVPLCEACGGVMKPNVVFFGEYVHDLEKALTEVQKADLLIVLGSSLSVYPAGMLPGYLHDNSKLVIINNQETSYDIKAKVVLRDDIETVVDKLGFLR